jgi:hypothetical protein
MGTTEDKLLVPSGGVNGEGGSVRMVAAGGRAGLSSLHRSEGHRSEAFVEYNPCSVAESSGACGWGGSAQKGAVGGHAGHVLPHRSEGHRIAQKAAAWKHSRSSRRIRADKEGAHWAQPSGKS